MTVFVVDVIGIGVITLIVWCFWLSPAQGIVAAATTVGIQEIRVAVKGGYSPDAIRVEAGRPVRPVFNRQETDPCSERVVFDAFGVSVDLLQGEEVPVEFTPDHPGEYEFLCQMGMLRGRLVVT